MAQDIDKVHPPGRFLVTNCHLALVNVTNPRKINRRMDAQI